VPTVQPPAPPAAVKPAPRAGDGLRGAGDALSSTVQGVGGGVAQLTEPLAPPVSAAVQDVLNLVAALLRQTTNGLGGTLDKLAAP